MHGVAALEGLLLRSTGDMRLRLSIRAAAVVATTHRRNVFEQVYSNYKLRSDYAHGSDIPSLSADQQARFMAVVAEVLLTALSTPLPRLEELDTRVIRWMPSPTGNDAEG
jgi:hypothetical protein